MTHEIEEQAEIYATETVDYLFSWKNTEFNWVRQNEINSRQFGKVPLAQPPKSVKIKIIHDESTFRWRIFYGLNGAEPITEFSKSKSGVYMKSPTNESCAAYILMSNVSVDLDNFEIRPMSR